MPTIRITYIDSVTPGVLGTKVYRDDIEIADVANGVQLWDDTTALEDTTYKYEVQAYTSGGESTEEVIGVNVENITTVGGGVWDIGNATDSGNIFTASDVTNDMIDVKIVGGKMYCSDTTVGFQYTPDQNNIGNSIYDNKSLTFQFTGIYGVLYMSLDGLKVFSINSNKYITRYILTIPFDLSSAGSSDQLVQYSSEVSINTGFWFNDDGSKMFLIDRNTGVVYMYNMGTPFDLTTGVYSSISYDDGTIGTLGAKYNMCFGDSGKVLLMTSNAGAVSQSNLSVAWDLTTASFTKTKILSGSGTYSISFSEDGNNLFIGDTSKLIKQYSL